MPINHLYHIPVMLEEAVRELAIKPHGIYVDLTFGGGGHTREILAHLSEKGQVWAFDQDPDAMAQAQKIEDDRLYVVAGNFRFFGHFLRAYHIHRVDGILVDLGVSSYQLDTRHRGFAARFDGPLDMRMHQQGETTAATIVNTYTSSALVELFRAYGDLRNATRLVACIVATRAEKRIKTTEELKAAIAPCVPPRREFKFYAKVFQALRIAVNDEVNALHDMLEEVPRLLAPDGRFVAITYHSGEDRPIKHFIKTGNVQGTIMQDMYGHVLRPLQPVHRKLLRPSYTTNNRARSAGMRVARLAQ